MHKAFRGNPDIAKRLQDVDIITRFCFKPLSSEEILPGTVWLLDLQTSADRSKAYPRGRWPSSVLHHKQGRPYLVVSESSIILDTGLVTVIPLATYSKRNKEELIFKNAFNLIEIESIADNEGSQGGYLGLVDATTFASPADVQTYSTWRFVRYVGSVTDEELKTCTNAISHLLELKKSISIKDIFPNKRLV